jgi:hypothetical protein
VTDTNAEKPDEKKPKKRNPKPYLALELDAFEDAAKCARKAGVHEDVILAGLPRVWVHCWRKKSDRVRPEDLDQFFTGADERLRRALAATGFIEIDGDPTGDRVKGAARLLRISASKAKGGHAAKGNLLRGSARPDPVPAHAGDGPGIGPADARLLQPAASSQQPTGLPPTPLASEGGGSGKTFRRARRDRQDAPADPPPRILGWTTATEEGASWRRRLDKMFELGAVTKYGLNELEKLLPLRFAGTKGLVVTHGDAYFADWAREHFGEALQLVGVEVEAKAPTSPPPLRLVDGGAA